MPNIVTYSDLPYTEYPAREDTHHRMTDVDANTIQYVKSFEFYYIQGDYSSCKDLLINHPELVNCMFNADKYNWMRDAIIAIERNYTDTIEADLSDIRTFIEMSLDGDFSWKFNLDYEVSDTFIDNQTEQISEEGEE